MEGTEVRGQMQTLEKGMDSDVGEAVSPEVSPRFPSQ